MKQNTAKITPELIQQNRLVFYPKTTEESVQIQEKLFAMGAVWAGDKGGKNLQHVADSIAKGLLSENGTIYYNPGEHPGNLQATLQQFDSSYLTSEQSFQQELFNKLSAKIDAIAARLEQVSAKVDKVHDEMFPTVTDTKPKLKPAGQG